MKKDMAKEIAKYPSYLLTNDGKLKRISITSLNDYDHATMELHHYIQYQAYERNKQWYIDHNIQQKLILVRKVCHEHIENRGIKVLTDEEFERKYNISRWKLLFNKRYSDY